MSSVLFGALLRAGSASGASALRFRLAAPIRSDPWLRARQTSVEMSILIDTSNPARVRRQAINDLTKEPLEPTALFRLCESCALLDRTVEAVAACSAGAARHPELSDYFHKRARALGAWRVPPPITPVEADPSQPIPRLSNPCRDEFASCVARRVPVVVNCGRPSADWTFEALLAQVTSAERQRGDGTSSAGSVSLSASGCVPDYGSKFESVRQVDMGLAECLRRVATPEGCVATAVERYAESPRLSLQARPSLVRTFHDLPRSLPLTFHDLPMPLGAGSRPSRRLGDGRSGRWLGWRRGARREGGVAYDP